MSYASQLMEKIVVNILDPIAYLLFAVALFFFMWG